MHPPRSGSPLISSWALVLLLPPLLYILTMPVGYVIGDPWDELAFATASEAVWRPHHLLTTALYRLVLALSAWLPGSRIIHLEVFMVVCATAALAGMYVLSEGSREGAFVVLIGTFANAFWLHGSTIETGMPSLTALTGAVLAATAWRKRMRGDTEWDLPFAVRWLRVLSSLLFVLAVLLHAQVVVLLPALCILLCPERGTARFVRSLACPVLVIGLLLGGAYVLAGVGVLGLTDPLSLWSWLTTHPNAQTVAHMSFGPLAVARSLSGLLRLFVDIDSAGTAVRGWLTGSDMAALGLPTLLRMVAAAGVVIFLVRWVLRGRRADSRLTLAAAAAATGLLIFNSCWLGSDPQFWLSLLPFLLPVVAHGMRATEKPRAEFLLASLLIAVLFGVNLVAREPSWLFPAGDAAHQRADLFRTSHRGALVITPGSRWTSALVSMQADVQVLQIFRLRNERDILRTFDREVDAALRQDRAVFAAGLENPSPEEAVTWEGIQSQFGISRTQLLRHVRARYRPEEDTLYGNDGRIALTLLRLGRTSVTP